MQLVFETHSWSEDNDRGLATGWLHGRLSERGRALARELGERRRADGIAAILSSDLRRATETVEVAFADAGAEVPVLLDWRLRECDYGALNGRPVSEVHAAVSGVDQRHPGGESWREAVSRAEGALVDIERRWPDDRVLVVGHMAVWWALRHRYEGMPIEDLGGGFVWQAGWTFDVARKIG